MSIYTKTGDKGTTALFGGHRVKKYAIRVEAYGTVDELNAAISVAQKYVTSDAHRCDLESIQHLLFYFGAEVASDSDDSVTQGPFNHIQPEDISALETLIDRCMAAVPKVNGFVLPGQTIAASFLHQARTIARRAERRLVQLSEESVIRPELLKYINRLSDALYAMAREEDSRGQWEAAIAEIARRYRQALLSQPATEKVNTLSPISTDLDFKSVHGLLKDAMQEAMQINVPVVIAIVDEHGNLINTYRMPNALLVSVGLAPKKAYTAVAMKTATHELKQSVSPEGELFQIETALNGDIVTFGGGYPLYKNGRIVGGIGISGGSVAQDMQIAEAALKGFNKG
jgi:ATP:cob(I)alamin adenosyltransferase